MNEPRIYASSIRYSQKVKDIIEAVPEGKTFADKFEFLALDFIEKSEYRISQLKNYDAIIEHRKVQAETISNTVLDIATIVADAKHLQMSLQKLDNICGTLITQLQTDLSKL